jgi:centrosomal protein CEP104
MDATILKPLNFNYFPEQDRVTEISKKSHSKTEKKVYEFLLFHPVCASSEMVGTSIEELLIHNYPNKRSWECSRICNFPQEVILRLDYRSHLKYVMLRAKVNRPIQEVELHIADGVEGNFNDATYRKIGTGKFITEEAQTVKVDGIGNYLKIVFTKPSLKTISNPFGQVSLSQLKIFGKKINYHITYDTFEENKTQELVDRILIDMGIPLNDPYYIVNDLNHEISAVDEETKITIKDMLNILYRSDKSIYTFHLFR